MQMPCAIAMRIPKGIPSLWKAWIIKIRMKAAIKNKRPQNRGARPAPTWEMGGMRKAFNALRFVFYRPESFISTISPLYILFP